MASKISLQKRNISFGGRKQRVELSKYVLVHKWGLDDLPHFMYNEKEMLRIHRKFRHPSVRAVQHMIERAQGGSLSADARKSIEKITED